MSDEKSPCQKFLEEKEELYNNQFNKSNDFDSFLISELSKHSKREQVEMIPHFIRFIAELNTAIESSKKYSKKLKD